MQKVRCHFIKLQPIASIKFQNILGCMSFPSQYSFTIDQKTKI